MAVRHLDGAGAMFFAQVPARSTSPKAPKSPVSLAKFRAVGVQRASEQIPVAHSTPTGWRPSIAHMAKASLTRVGNSADSSESLPRLLPAMGHDAEKLEG
jgi:hypothetical protein